MRERGRGTKRTDGEKFNIRDIMHRGFRLAESRERIADAFIDPRIRSYVSRRSAEQLSFCGKFESSDGCTDWLLKAKDDAPASAAPVAQLKLSVAVA